MTDPSRSNPPTPTAATGARLAQLLLNPRSVALVGISADAAKTGGRPLRFLRQAGFEGEIFNVNPARDTVQGERAYRTLADLPRRPDHAFVMTGTEQAVADVAECGRLGIPMVTVLAGGFSEAGPEGAAREQQLRALASEYGMRLLGPSSIGVVNLQRGLMLTANAAFAEAGLPRGGVLCASQSGSLIGALVSRGAARGIGFHSLVSVGGEVDLGVGEVCAATLDDPEVSAYVLFLESMRHAAALRAFAEGAAARGKPVVAYKLGRSAAGAELAVSHTGTLAGDDDVADAFLTACGIARVDTFEGLLEAPALLRRVPPLRRTRPPQVGVVTTTGGGAAMVVDQLGVRGIETVAPSAATMARLAAANVAAVPGRIVDLTLAGTRYDVMKAALDVLRAAPEFDLVLAVIGSSARSQPELAVKPVVDASAEGGAPLACFVVPDAPQALQQLGAAGVPCFRAPETCADVIAAAVRRQPPRLPVAGPVSAAEAPGAATRSLDEAQAYTLLEQLGLPHAAMAVLPADAQALPLAGPVAVKLLHAQIAHKTEVGGVVLGVHDDAGLRDAIARIDASLAMHRPELKLERVLVQTMTKGLAEVLLGFRRDPQVGPVVVLAGGGVLTELMRDRALRLAPITLDIAYEMISEVKSLAVLAGYRGLPRGDLAALAQALVAFSQLALLREPAVLEAEVNPMIVKAEGQGVAAVDALVRLASSAEQP